MSFRPPWTTEWDPNQEKKKTTVFASGHDYNFFYLSFKDSSKGEQNLHKKAICIE